MRRNVLLASAALSLVLFAQPVMADGNLACSDITQVRYMLEKYAVNDPDTYCVRASTLSDANPNLREEVKREAKKIGNKHGISYPDCNAVAIAPAPATQTYVYQQPAPVYQPPAPIYQPPAPVYQAPPAVVTGNIEPAVVTTTTRVTGSHAGAFIGSDMVWAGLGLLAAGGTAAALITTGTVGGSTPTPPTTSCVTSEFSALYALGNINADDACARGFNGAGIPVALLDTGVDINHFDLKNQIVTGSGYDFVTNTAGQPAASALNSHGTEVAGVLAAERNDIGMYGVAYGAKLLPLRVFNSSGTGIASFAGAINYAVSSGTRILNGSYGPDYAWHLASSTRGHQIITAADLQEGPAYVAAAQAGMILIFPTGNEYTLTPNVAVNPTGPGFLPFIKPANANLTTLAAGAYRDESQNVLSTTDFSAMQPLTIVVGGVDRSNNILAFSNRCGVAKDWCMVAPAVDIYTTTLNGQYTTVSGTSFAAPQVSAAAAILKQEFPNLTSEQIVARLLATATDLGAPGTDEVYGHGLLNLDAATQPVSTTGITTTGLATGYQASLKDTNLKFGHAFGLNASALLAANNIMFLDSQGAAFKTSLSSMVTTNSDSLDTEKAVFRFDRPDERKEISSNGTTLGFTVDGGKTALDDMMLNSDGPSEPSSDLSNIRAFQISENVSESSVVSVHYRDAQALSLGFSEGDRAGFERSLNKEAQLNPYAAFAGAGYASTYQTQALGGTLRMSGFFGGSEKDSGAQGFGTQAEADYKLAPGSNAFFSVGTLFEENRVLGSKGSGGFAFGQGTMTSYTGLGTKMALGDNTAFRASGYAGMTNPSLTDKSLISDASTIITTAFNAAVDRASNFKKGDKLSFGVAQPLRVESGSMQFNLPYARSSTTEQVYSTRLTQDLAAQGREIDLEANYAFPIAAGENVSAGGLYRMDAGHRAGVNDALAVMRWTKKF